MQRTMIRKVMKRFFFPKEEVQASSKAGNSVDRKSTSVHIDQTVNPYGPGAGYEDETMNPYGPGAGYEDETMNPYGPSTGGGDETMNPYGPSTGGGDETVNPYGSSTGFGDETVNPYRPSAESGDETVNPYGPSAGSGDETVNPYARIVESEHETVNPYGSVENRMAIDEEKTINPYAQDWMPKVAVGFVIQDAQRTWEREMCFVGSMWIGNGTQCELQIHLPDDSGLCVELTCGGGNLYARNISCGSKIVFLDDNELEDELILVKKGSYLKIDQTQIAVSYIRQEGI